jgi:molecular chaperone DnaK
MIQEAERYAEEDKRRRDEAERLNAADALCYQAEKTLADFGDRLSLELRNRIKQALRETRDAHAKRDAQLASQRAESLKQVLQEVGREVYTSATGPKPPPHVGPETGEARPSGSGPRGRVVDAEYQEKKKG